MLQAEDHAIETLSKPLIDPPAATFHTARALWRCSVGALAMANVLDAQSSWGKRELNPNLSGSQGTFGLHGALLKLGIQGSVVGLEYLILRHRPSARLYHLLTVINSGDAAVTGVVVAHNYTIPRP
jgi:hypothetical protein